MSDAFRTLEVENAPNAAHALKSNSLLNLKRRQTRPLSPDPIITFISQPYAVISISTPAASSPVLYCYCGRELTAKNDMVVAVFFSAERYSEVYTLPS